MKKISIYLFMAVILIVSLLYLRQYNQRRPPRQLTAIRHSSPNFRKMDGRRIDTLVIHATFDDLAAVNQIFASPDKLRSAHYLIAKNGDLHQYVDEGNIAFHAGESRMSDGRSSVNDFSIGIELENRNDGQDPYPQKQLSSLQELIKDVCNRHPIVYIKSHAQIAFPRGRKSDPQNLETDRIAAAAKDYCPDLKSAPVYSLAQAQSHLSTLGNAPLFSANWGGRNRPYSLVEGKMEPLNIKSFPYSEFIDLLSPQEFADESVLMVGSREGRPSYDIFHLDKDGNLTNITSSEHTDDGDLCISEDKQTVSHRSGESQFIRHASDITTAVKIHSPLPFHRCAFAISGDLFGISRKNRQYTLYRCSRDGQCKETELLSDFEKVLDIHRVNDSLVLSGRQNSRPYYRTYLLNSASLSLTEQAKEIEADVLQSDSETFRLGRHSRYYLSGRETKDDIIYSFREINDVTYAIASNPTRSKTLAVWEDNNWRYLYPHGVTEEYPSAPIPEEVWLKPGGLKVQAFLFPAQKQDQSKSLIWLHGGPYENVSPRYNAYFHALSEAGITVLALNYPGSTGQGREYEMQFKRETVGNSIMAAINYLEKKGFDTPAIWSISAAHMIVRFMLEGNFPVNHYIEQVGQDHLRTSALAANKAKRIFFIRGLHDHLKERRGIDYLYDGGHDITLDWQLYEAIEKVLRFLKG